MLTLLFTAPLYLAARLLGATPRPAEPPREPVPMTLVRCPTCRGGAIYRTRRPPCPTCGGCGEIWRLT